MPVCGHGRVICSRRIVPVPSFCLCLCVFVGCASSSLLLPPFPPFIWSPFGFCTFRLLKRHQPTSASAMARLTLLAIVGAVLALSLTVEAGTPPRKSYISCSMSFFFGPVFLPSLTLTASGGNHCANLVYGYAYCERPNNQGRCQYRTHPRSFKF